MSFIGCCIYPSISKRPNKKNKQTCLLRACKALESDAAKLDEEYNRLTDVMAEGERDEFSIGCLG